jgi:hypothetical protein
VSYVSVLASPVLLARAGCSNMFLGTHYNLTPTWIHPVHSLTLIFHKTPFSIILKFICTFPKWSPLFDLQGFSFTDKLAAETKTSLLNCVV